MKKANTDGLEKIIVIGIDESGFAGGCTVYGDDDWIDVLLEALTIMTKKNVQYDIESLSEDLRKTIYKNLPSA